MNGDRAFPWALFLGLGITGMLTLLAAFVIGQAEKSRAAIPVYGEVPPYEFFERSGEPFSLRNLRDKISVVDFIFTRCPGICPVMTAAMSELYQLYAAAEIIQFISISVDPEFDTPEVLRQYAQDHGVTDSRWVFLNGPLEEVVQLCEEGLGLPAEDLPEGHSTKFVLVDSDGQIRGYYDSGDEQSLSVLKTHIHELYKAK